MAVAAASLSTSIRAMSRGARVPYPTDTVSPGWGRARCEEPCPPQFSSAVRASAHPIVFRIDPPRSSRLHASAARGTAVTGVLAQLRVRADLALRDREALFVCGERALTRGVGIVGLEAGGPVARLARVASHQVEPPLRLESQLPGSLH